MNERGTLQLRNRNAKQTIRNQLETMRIVLVLDNELQALLLLSSLPDSLDTLVVPLSHSATDGKQTMSQVTSSLLNEELKTTSSESSHSQTLVLEERARSKSSNNNQQSWRRSKSRNWVLTCHHCGCGGVGHLKGECRKSKQEKRNQSSIPMGKSSRC